MAVEFKTLSNAAVAVLPAIFDDAAGQEFVTEVKTRIPKGGRLIVDAAQVLEIDYQGMAHLISVRTYVSSPEQKSLLMSGVRPDIWRKIEDQGLADMFDSRPTLAEAVALLPGGTPQAQAQPRLADDNVRMANVQASEGDGANVWRSPVRASPPPLPTVPDVPGPSSKYGQPPPISPVPPEANPWAAYKPTNSAKPGARSPAAKKWIIGGAVLGLLVIVGLLWFFLVPGTPKLSLSASTIEAEEGAQPDLLIVTIYNGDLDLHEAMAGMPDGLKYELRTEDGASPMEYVLGGAVNPGAKSGSVTLSALRGDKRSAPETLTITVKPKPLRWAVKDHASFTFEANKPVSGYTKILTGSSSPVAVAGLPEGLKLATAANVSTDWELQGTPARAGVTEVTFTATSGEARHVSIEVKAAAAVAGSTTDSSKPNGSDSVANVPNSNSPPVPDEHPIVKRATPDDGSDRMRAFLLERIEKLDSRYSDEERDRLHNVVSKLREARLVHTTFFEKDGQVKISLPEKEKLLLALQSAENSRLLHDPDCQIIVVGYASASGSFAANVRYSKQRTAAVDQALTAEIGRNADLCGDYGPTDVVDKTGGGGNRAVEIFAGTLKLTPIDRPVADKFKADFNRRHGVH